MSDLVCPSCGETGGLVVLTEDESADDGFRGVCDACTFEWEPKNSPLMAALRSWYATRRIWLAVMDDSYLDGRKPTRAEAGEIARSCLVYQAAEDLLIREFARADSDGHAEMERAPKKAAR